MATRSEYLNQGLAKLKEEQVKGYQVCLQNISKWIKFRDDYEQLKQKLDSLPDKINYDIMVPFGSVAFMPGKLIHTNEIMVHLGDNWFAERSAKQASEIVTRRIAQCNNSLAQFEIERKQFEQWMLSTKDVQQEVEGDAVDFVEEFDEGKEQVWREKHRQSVKKYHQNKSREESQGKEAQIEEEYWRKMELSESESKEISEAESDEMIENLSSESDLASSEDDETETSKQTETRNRKSVQWKEAVKDSSQDTSFSVPTVKIKFTDYGVPLASNSNESSTLKDVQTIQSPSDIYKYFSTESKPVPLKSILKSSSNRQIPIDPPVIPPLLDLKKATDLPKSVEQTENKAFTYMVVERDMESMTSTQHPKDTATPMRKMSKFKERQLMKRTS